MIRNYLIMIISNLGCQVCSQFQKTATIHSVPHRRQGLLVYSVIKNVIKWRYFPRYWPVVLGIHRSPVNSPHKGQWRGTLVCVFFDLRLNKRLSKRDTGELRRHSAHYDALYNWPACQLALYWQTRYDWSSRVTQDILHKIVPVLVK